MNAKKGFTLIEIMIVVAIIAILAAIAIPNFIAYRQTAQLNACKANVQTIKNACEAYTVKSGTSATMAALTSSANGSPFLKSEPKCPIDKSTTYEITYTAASQEYTVKCGNQSATHNVADTAAAAE